MPTSYVYLARTESGIHKIGRSKNPLGRLQQLQYQAGESVELLHVIASTDAKSLESELLELCKSSVVKGREWFVLTKEQIEMILAIAGTNLGDLPDRSCEPFTLRFPDHRLVRVLDEHATDERRSRNLAIIVLIEKAMAAEGRWPPKD